ncbi:MAG: glycosyltransferase family 2 protein [Proteobacteria bacterium]|nr:glycosyltransferase family 2 protein [Pseudomonadota bacterium]
MNAGPVRVAHPIDENSAPELCIVVPVFNERDNVRALVMELAAVLDGLAWEVIFVDDDSPDGTAQAVRELDLYRARVRCLQRIGRRGLSTACTEGMLASSAPFLAVMDGDLQHDPKILPAMLGLLRGGEVELAVGSRYVEGGSTADWNSRRRAVSRLATRLGHVLAPDELRDPMSGFFMLRRSLLEQSVRNLSSLGFKILLDIFASCGRPIVFREVPYVFRTRRAGVSKLDSLVAWEYLMLLADKLVGRWVPVRFIAFAAVGAAGVAVHLSVLNVSYRALGAAFVTAQGIATGVSIVFNYALNNLLTYRDKRRRGLHWLTGLVSFVAACSIGAVANVSVAAYLFDRHLPWVIAALGGITAGAVWNYAISSVYTWNSPKRS